jgi:peptidase M28-like protein
VRLLVCSDTWLCDEGAIWEAAILMGIATQRLRSAIECLAAIDRSSCSKGEHEAAEWIAAALKELGAEATVEREQVHGTYWWPLGITSGLGILAERASRRGARMFGAAVAGGAAAEVADELGAGPRVLRRLLPKQTTANVIARMGDPNAARTLVVVAHHDAAHTSIFFDPRITAHVGFRSETGPDNPTQLPPVMAPIAIAPGLVALGSIIGARRVAGLGALMCAGIIASFVEIALRRTVPGANDNLTGVATLIGLARALNERPVNGLRVLLVSTGAEESLMEGMRAFAARHLPDMSREQTQVLCVDTVGSPYLVLAEAEGMLRLRRYDDEFNQLIFACADATGVTLHRGFRMRLGTDGLVALRRGFPAAMLTSVNERGSLSNYHWPTDTPERVDYSRLGDAVRLCECVTRRLADDPAFLSGTLSQAERDGQQVRQRSAGGP